MLHLRYLLDEREPLELVPREDTSPSSSGTSYSGGSSCAPDGNFADNVVEYVQEGCSVGSLKSSNVSISSCCGSRLDVLFACSALRLVSGRGFFNGRMFFAFFRPDVHQSSRSSGTEVVELLPLLTEGAADDNDRSFSFSLAMRCFRSPTFSVSGSVQDKSAENMTIVVHKCGAGSLRYKRLKDWQESKNYKQRYSTDELVARKTSGNYRAPTKGLA
jgi:hypothetical protein